MKRVEIVLHAPRQRNIVALGEARFYGAALTSAIDKLAAQVRKLGATRKSGVRKRAATRDRKLGVCRREATRAPEA